RVTRSVARACLGIRPTCGNAVRRRARRAAAWQTRNRRQPNRNGRRTWLQIRRLKQRALGGADGPAVSRQVHHLATEFRERTFDSVPVVIASALFQLTIFLEANFPPRITERGNEISFGVVVPLQADRKHSLASFGESRIVDHRLRWRCKFCVNGGEDAGIW